MINFKELVSKAPFAKQIHRTEEPFAARRCTHVVFPRRRTYISKNTVSRMNVEILSIGDELLIGQVINTNASWLGEQFSLLGMQVRRVTAVGDSVDDLLIAFDRAMIDNDVVVVTGGLGPTHDDVTRSAVLRFFNTTLTLNEQVARDIEAFFAARRRTPTAVNRDQAMTPIGAIVIRNPHGTAPGYHFRLENKHFFVIPGVPYEMQSMVESYIIPEMLKEMSNARASLTVLTTGIPESTLSEILNGIDSMIPNTSTAFLPSVLGVRVRLTGKAVMHSEAEQAVHRLRDFILSRAGEFVYGYDADTLEQRVGAMLTGRNFTLATAESCTGGLLSDRITNVAGSSRYFERGIVAYSNECKINMLGVDPRIIETFGAVSGETAESMAAAMRSLAGTDIAVSITGIAGPDGGSLEKPVGLTWIGLSTESTTVAHEFHFGDARLRNKQRAAQAALDMIRRYLASLPLVPSLHSTTS